MGSLRPKEFLTPSAVGTEPEAGSERVDFQRCRLGTLGFARYSCSNSDSVATPSRFCNGAVKIRMAQLFPFGILFYNLNAFTSSLGS